MTDRILERGRYEHREAGLATGVYESWQQVLRPNGKQYLSITFDASALKPHGYLLHATVEWSAEPFIYFSYRYSDGIYGRYTTQGEYLDVIRVLSGDACVHDRLPWSADMVFDLPFLSTKGNTILALIAHPMIPTFAPLLRVGDRAGDLTKQSVQPLGETTVRLNEVDYAVQHVRYQRDYWLNADGVVFRAIDGDYEMVLTEYER